MHGGLGTGFVFKHAPISIAFFDVLGLVLPPVGALRIIFLRYDNK